MTLTNQLIDQQDLNGDLCRNIVIITEKLNQKHEKSIWSVFRELAPMRTECEAVACLDVVCMFFFIL